MSEAEPPAAALTSGGDGGMAELWESTLERATEAVSSVRWDTERPTARDVEVAAVAAGVVAPVTAAPPAEEEPGEQQQYTTAMDEEGSNPWRDEIVRTIFGDVGIIRKDFSCAIERKILLHGRLYVTDRFICFYSNLFGFEKKIKIPYSHISCITKEYTAAFIPNAIAIITLRKEYIFRSFWDRDECYEILRNFHDEQRGVLPEPPPSAQPSSADLRLLDDVDDDEEPQQEEESPPMVAAVSVVGEIEGPGENETLEVHQKPPVATEVLFESERRLVHELNSTVLDVPMAGFFEHFLGDAAELSLVRFHQTQGDCEVSATQWAHASPTERTREIRFRRALNSPIGPSSTRTTKVQHCRRFGARGIVVNTVMSMEDIPFRDCFTIADRWVIEPTEDGRTRVRFEHECVFSKSTIWRRRIENSSRTDLTAFYESYVVAARTYLAARSPKERRMDADGKSTDAVTQGLQAEIARISHHIKKHPGTEPANNFWFWVFFVVGGLFLLFQRRGIQSLEENQSTLLKELQDLRAEVARFKAASSGSR